MAATTGQSVVSPRAFALGIANGDVPEDPSDFTTELAHSWRKRGLACVAVGFAQPASQLNIDSMRDLRSMLADTGIRVSEFAGVNANLVHPDSEVRDEAVQRVRAAVGPASALGVRAVNSGAGSCSRTWREYFYRADAGNFAEAAEDRAVETLGRIAQVMGDTDLLYTVECHQLTTMRSAAVIRRVLDRVDHPQIRANFDPINLLDTAYAAYTSAERIPEIIDTVGPRYAPTCHIKDMVVTDGMPLATREVPPGKGVVRVETIFDAARQLPGDEPVDLIVEHLGAEANAAIKYVRQHALDAGIQLT